ncbi:MAG: hypothetical protein GYB50_16410 [Rhodobacteraceae bacterium]|nr:hypothetical protein [Paracoccaceae bacterium]
MSLDRAAPAPASYSTMQKRFHWGVVAWFGRVGAAAGLHETATTLLLWVMVLHVGGALPHPFLWRDEVLRRMI